MPTRRNSRRNLNTSNTADASVLPSAPNPGTRIRHRARKQNKNKYTSIKSVSVLQERVNNSPRSEKRFLCRAMKALKKTPLKGRTRTLTNGVTCFVPSPPMKRNHNFMIKTNIEKNTGLQKPSTSHKASKSSHTFNLAHDVALENPDDYVTPHCGASVKPLENVRVIFSNAGAQLQSWLQNWWFRRLRSKADNNSTQTLYGAGGIDLTNNDTQTPSRPKVSVAARNSLQMQVLNPNGSVSKLSDFIQISEMQVSPTQLTRLPPGQYTINNIDNFIDTMEKAQGLEPGTSMERKKHDMLNQMKDTLTSKKSVSQIKNSNKKNKKRSHDSSIEKIKVTLPQKVKSIENTTKSKWLPKKQTT